MLLRSLFSLALTTASTLTSASPLFLLASTADLSIEPADTQPNLPVSHVQNVLWRNLASCPTQHYIVVVEPQTLSYISATTLTPQHRNAHSVYRAEDIDGTVSIVHVINTILMDCLHHGVLRVEELDARAELPELDRDTAQKSIMYVRMGEVDVDMGREEYVEVVEGRKAFVEQVTKKYFDETDYTLIYMREEMVQVADEVQREDGAEIPLVD